MKIGQNNIIEETNSFDESVQIGNFNVIAGGGTFKKNAVIGNYCEVGANIFVGESSILQGRIRTAGNCRIEDNVTLKYGVILTSDVTVKKGAFLGPNVITLGSTHERVTIHGTTIGENTYIGASSIIGPNVQIGDNIVVGANSFVNKDITEPGIYVGTPVRKIK